MNKKWFAIPMLLAIGAMILAGGCFPPVDENADVFISGKVLDLDGTPMSGQKVELYKSTAPFWVYGNWLESILETDGNTFRTATTDSNGEFEIQMKGADANTPSGSFAAYFAVVVFHDENREMAVATEDHVFSNEDLTWALPEMQFWDVGQVDVDQQTLYMDFTWPDLPKNPSNDYLITVNDGDWAQWVNESQTSLTSLPVEVLNPDKAQCTWQALAWSTGLRYRSDLHTFANQNIFNPIDTATATDGEGNELPGVTDGEYTDKETFTGNMDARSVILDLGSAYEVTAFVIHHAWIYSWWSGTASISTSMDGNEWDAWDTVSGEHQDWGLFYHYKIDMQGRTCRYVKIDLSGPDGVKFDYIGELAAFGNPIQ